MMRDIEMGISEGAGLDNTPGLKKALILMHQRRQQEPYKIDTIMDETKKEIAKGQKVVIFVSPRRIAWRLLKILSRVPNFDSRARSNRSPDSQPCFLFKNP